MAQWWTASVYDRNVPTEFKWLRIEGEPHSGQSSRILYSQNRYRDTYIRKWLIRLKQKFPGNCIGFSIRVCRMCFMSYCSGARNMLKWLHDLCRPFPGALLNACCFLCAFLSAYCTKDSFQQFLSRLWGLVLCNKQKNHNGSSGMVVVTSHVVCHPPFSLQGSSFSFIGT